MSLCLYDCALYILAQELTNRNSLCPKSKVKLGKIIKFTWFNLCVTHVLYELDPVWGPGQEARHFPFLSNCLSPHHTMPTTSLVGLHTLGHCTVILMTPGWGTRWLETVPQSLQKFLFINPKPANPSLLFLPTENTIQAGAQAPPLPHLHPELALSGPERRTVLYPGSCEEQNLKNLVPPSWAAPSLTTPHTR